MHTAKLERGRREREAALKAEGDKDIQLKVWSTFA
jgi:hypothetical protein